MGIQDFGQEIFRCSLLIQTDVMKIPLIFVRDKRYFSLPSSKFVNRRVKNPYPGGKKHYVYGEPPLGIMYLSSILKQAGHEVTLSDQSHPEYSDEKFVESLIKERPDMVGISFLSNVCYPAACSLSRKIKAALPSTKIVYGGVFSTINAEKIVASEASVDIVARGDGEGIIRDLAEGLDKLDDIPGITFRSEAGEVVETPDREMIEDLDSIPFPDRESLDINYIASLPLTAPAVIWDRPFTTLQSSRGCPFDCVYCNCPTFSNRKCRFRSAENVLKEIDEIEREGYSSFCFIDDNFLLKTERVEEICEGMIANHHSFKWACEGRIDPQVNGIFDKLSAAGCDMVMFGIESGSQRILDSMKKRTKLPDIAKGVANAKKAGISIIHGFFILGSVGETVEELERTFTFAERLKINTFGFNSLLAFRGTSLWDEAVASGLIDEEKHWDKMFAIHAIHPDAIDSKTLFKLKAKFVKRLIVKKILRNPLVAAKIFKRFLDSMSVRDLYQLLRS